MAPINFGILMVPYQMLDVSGPVDILACGSVSLIQFLIATGTPLPADLASRAIDVKFHHINTTLDPVTMTAGLQVIPTTTTATCPELDYLLIGGPDITTYVLPDEFTELIKRHVSKGKQLFTTCTGGLAIASTGVLDGKRATTNHMVLEMARKIRPQVEWVKEQWVEEGNIWTAGGACAGMDMIAHWVGEKYGEDVRKVALMGLDFEPRGRDGKVIKA